METGQEFKIDPITGKKVAVALSIEESMKIVSPTWIDPSTGQVFKRRQGEQDIVESYKTVVDPATGQPIEMIESFKLVRDSNGTEVKVPLNDYEDRRRDP
jgi:hypothetical protein